MARKKITIIDQELTPTVLAVKADKKKTNFWGFIWVVLIFSVLVAGVYYLPDLATIVNNYLNKDSVVTNYTKDRTNTNVSKEEQKTVVVEYDFSKELNIEKDNLRLSKFDITNSTLSFEITNIGSSIIDLESHNYFLTLYSDKKVLLQKIKVNGIVLAGGESVNKTYELNNPNVSKITFLELKEEEYPAHVLSADENGKAIMICSIDNVTINYYLKDNKLYGIQKTIVLNNTDENYENLKAKYENDALTYSNVEGIRSSVSEIETGISFRTIVDLSKTDGKALEDTIIFSNNTDAKVIHYDLSARGYSCN